MKSIRRVLVASAVALAGAMSVATSARAAAPSWPAKPLRVIVGFAAGGPTDVMVRAFAEYATRSLGQNFIVENRPGANTQLASELQG